MDAAAALGAFYVLTNVVVLGLAMRVLLTGRRDRLARAFTAYLFAAGLQGLGIAAVQGDEACGGCLGASGQVALAAAPVFALVAPFLAFYVAMLYREHHGAAAVRRWHVLALGAAAAAMLLAYAAWPRLYWGDGLGPIAFAAFWLGEAGLATVALVLWGDAIRAPGPRRRPLLAATAAFAIFPLYYGPHFLVPEVMGAPPAVGWLFVAGAAPALLLAPRMAIAARRDASLREDAGPALLAMALPLASVALLAAVRASLGTGPAVPLMWGLTWTWSLALPVGVTWAILREDFLRLQPLGARLRSGAASLGSGPDPRAVDAYRAALEEAHAGGPPTPREAAMLARLRAQLGLSGRDHALIEHLVVGAAGSDGGAGSSAGGPLVLGKYRLLRSLGQGAHGQTHLAEDTVLRREVVVKALRDRSGEGLLLREARAMAALRHPNVVTVHDVEQVGEDAFIIMEHAEAGSLQAALARGPLGQAAFRGVALDLLAGLEAVHAAGLVHRDVKPSNVLLTRDGRAKLADFGVAHLPGYESTLGGGDGVGTAGYMSPEQAKGRPATPRSDLYSAAATLYEARTGRRLLAPEPNESAVELRMRAAQAGRFEARLDAPEALRAWFARALEPDPAQRFPSATAMREALERALG